MQITRSRSSSLLAPSLLLLLAPTAAAHVDLLSPSGGETYTAGSTQTLRWQIAVQHDTQNWDLSYSTSGPGGPWLDIAVDLPPGDTSSGSIHTLNWTVPDEPTLQLHVRVQQDNSGTDYLSSNGAAVTLIGSGATDCNANGVPDAQDNDFNGDALVDECQTFYVDVPTVSLGAGTAQVMSLDAGSGFGGELYVVLGSISGTSPGLPLGGVLLPLNVDSYTVTTISSANGSILGSTFGTLDANGRANATFSAASGEINTSLAGLELDHAFIVLQGSQVTFASNAMPLELVP